MIQESSRNTAISVIIPCFNSARTLEETLVSLVGQTFLDWEGIIVNDGSSDTTQQIAETWAKRDSRLRVISQANKGLGAARNSALKIATGRLVHCLDGDDKISADFYERIVEAEKAHGLAPEGLCLTAGYIHFRDDGTVLKRFAAAPPERYTFERIAYSNATPPVAYVFGRSILEKTGLFDESIKHCQDWDLLIRMVRTGVRFAAVPEALAMYRVSDNSLSTKTIRFMETQRIVALRAATPDPRCIQSAVVATPVSTAGAERSIIHLWNYNVGRALKMGWAESAAELFTWGRLNLPAELWEQPGRFGVSPTYVGREVPSEIPPQYGPSRSRLLATLRFLSREWPQITHRPGFGRTVLSSLLNLRVLPGAPGPLSRLSHFRQLVDTAKLNGAAGMVAWAIALSPGIVARSAARRFKRTRIGDVSGAATTGQ
ncbi:MAG: glycosyltransferase [SAR202 cluster bacterium]|nr:glycosyltransferase [SAR202 cluster bacterium]